MINGNMALRERMMPGLCYDKQGDGTSEHTGARKVE